MIKERIYRTGLRVTTILVFMVVGIVAVTLCCLISLFMNRYWNSVMQGARTTSSQSVSQVSNTVSNYLTDMNQAMEMVEQSMSENEKDRDELMNAFLTFRPDIVAVTSYSSEGGTAAMLVPWPYTAGKYLPEPFLQLGTGPSH